MKPKIIEVSDEYLSSLCDWMLEWVTLEDSLTFPDFLQSRGIGLFYFKYFQQISDKVNNTYECVKYQLHNRWLKKAMTQTEIPAHQVKILNKYLNLYDSHARDLVQQDRLAVAEVEKTIEHHYSSDNYANSQLEPTYQVHFEKSANKCGSKAKAK